MDTEQMRQFLIEAEGKTYLAGKEGDAFKTELYLSLPREIVYEYPIIILHKPKLRYIDRYFGRIKFIGQEMIFKDYNVPVWGRSYHGITSPVGDYTEEVILDWVRQERARLMPSLWSGVTALKSPLVDDLVFVIHFQRPVSVSFDNFIYHEWILSNYREEDEEENEGVLFHRVCVGGVIE